MSGPGAGRKSEAARRVPRAQDEGGPVTPVAAPAVAAVDEGVDPRPPAAVTAVALVHSLDEAQPGEEAARTVIDRARLLGDWIDRARRLGPEFRRDVVQRVVTDYVAQLKALFQQSAPAFVDLRRLRRRVELESQRIHGEIEAQEAAIDELRLRHLIGELARDRYDERRKECEAAAGDLRGDLARVATRATGLDELLQALATIQADIEHISREPDGDGDSRGGGTESPSGELDLEPSPEDEALAATSVAPAMRTAPPAAPPPIDQDGAIWAGPGPSLDGDAPPPHSSAEWQAAVERSASGPKPVPRARLVVRRADGQEDPLWMQTDLLTVGRGRNNDIQLRHDAKVSRYHCRILRQGEEFYLEDNRSRNGTLVDNVLTPRKRLVGGERITIGDTQVKFELIQSSGPSGPDD